MRVGGVRVGAGEVVSALRALNTVEAWRREDARMALRTALCSGYEDLAVFDAAFDDVFSEPRRREPDPLDANGPGGDEGGVQQVSLAEGVEGDPGQVEPALVMTWSAAAIDRSKSFADYTDAERAAVQRVLDQLARRTPRRQSRRTRPTRHRQGHALDLRGTVRASLSHLGEPVQRHWRVPTQRPRPLVLVCDVSGSMEPYARVLLQFAQACVTARRRVEVFAFGTRLTRITRELTHREPDLAIARASEAVTDWSGGTRIGASLATLNREHGRRLGRGATVIILSDGWDRGEPDLLAAEMERLGRTSHRIIWLNPLAAQPGYEPLARGMRAALPHTEHLLPGNSLASLEHLTRTLEGM